MKLKDFSCILLLLFTLNSFSQHKISGIIISEDGKKLALVDVYDKTSGAKYLSNSKGEFLIKLEKPGNYELVFYKESYAVLEKTISTSDENIVIILDKVTNLSEVVINKQNDKIFALTKLKDIDETAIYAGKKTEVISLNKLTANKATNNARQIFAQVVGLTINESSDGGLQLSIGGRGLDPNRTSNFNTRQNGYDISADVLGYPESYYATPTEALEEIQVVRGAASLQYGTQFGGLINFKLKTPVKKPIEFLTRTTLGSYGLYTNFTSLSGTNDKFSYYTFYNYKQGNGFRPNSEFESKNYFGNLNYQFTDKTSLHFDYTHFDYLAHQAGGLTDAMFNEDPTQSNRTRNWFAVNWNLFALRLKHKFNTDSDLSLQLFGLDASRKAVGYRSNRVSNTDTPGTERDLIIGDFVNWGAEARFLKRYKIKNNGSAFLIGAKYYQSKNTGVQGPGSSGSDANFNVAGTEFPFYGNQSNYRYPNLNVSVFGENIFKITSNFSVTPGFRFEKIKTQATGFYRRIIRHADILYLDETKFENNIKDRNFILLGIGLSYKPLNRIEFYGNVSQNYRSVTFNDIRTASPSQVIDADITDETGYTSDIGIRGQIGNKVTFDASVYGLYYDDKIGEYETQNPNGSAAPVRFRGNIGTAVTYGFETMFDWSLNKTFFKQNDNFVWNVFSNIAITDSEYLKSDAPNIEGNKVEFVPFYNIKTGTGIGYKNFISSVQFTYLSSQFTDANNSITDNNDNTYGVFGQIPAYYVADFSTSYKWRKFKLEAGITNFTNNSYFTRRATGYPGPGIIPSDPRTFYTTLEFIF
ncbi:TonB-dependent receptor domain-containing protein [Flavobacterium sp. GT3R68]|uniref:TonB-dependent receptor domain-containing protein n=1 Tax=Flavobacterium sp. GT3R68 TaxID=2594437 RepID=UPI000F89D14B|nr:TonB-dependent receptor [Flavobacterium sp. GT3R68]RTY95394.1 TonB-dependent receptor [Flavobacterium sp. GSN2]TRW91172.1 TonB-dependent receptor [Flavobacterium sp. GT3R68]